MTWFLWHHVRAVGLALLLLAVHCAQVVAYSPLSDESLRNLPSAGEDFDIKTGKLLAPILIPRVPGTDGSKKVQHHFVDFFTEHLPQWNIEYQNSTSKTPATGESDVPFVNLIFSRDPPWAQSGNVGRLTLVAHYDSKLSPAGFIGATDSAAPCAMLLHAARSIDEALTRKWDAMELEGSNDGLGADRGVQILFLDGEEAFVSWSDSDSLYGARSLAETWEHTSNQPLSIFKSRLSEIDLFVLLDLLGAPNPTVPSYFQTTHWAYQNLAKIEARLRDLTLLQSKPKHPFLPESQKTTIFQSGVMQDDHIPFIRRGIEILHLIAAPFPRVWHTMDDDGEHLDLGTVHDWAQIITAFAAEWMELEGYLPDAAPSAQQAKTKRRTEL